MASAPGVTERADTRSLPHAEAGSPRDIMTGTGTGTGTAAAASAGGEARGVVSDHFSPHGLALSEPDGGSNYWQRYGHPAGYLPLGVYFQSISSQADVALDKAAGFNLYMGTDHAYDDMGLLAANDMWAWMFAAGQGGALADYDTWKANPRVTGWVLTDERDMLGDSDRDAQQGLDLLATERAIVPDDGRLVYSNYGKGVAFWHPDSYVERFLNHSDVSSGDIYWHSGPELMKFWQAGSFLRTPATEYATEAEVRLSANYGLYVDKMRRLSTSPVLNFVEAAPLGGWGSIGAGQQRADAWHSLLAGARGIGYFVTAFDGDGNYVEQSLHRKDAAIRDQLGRLNAEIAGYASVLNSSDVAGLVTHPNAVRSLSKWDGTSYTIFTGSMQQTSQSATFAVNVPVAAVEVLGEQRTLPVTGGTFTDTFADGDAIHIYRLVL